MTFELKIDSDNDAFQDDDGRPETVRILQEIIRKIERGAESGAVMDVNGNRVGIWSF